MPKHTATAERSPSGSLPLNGKSAYELAKESGYSGTEKEFSDAVAANASAPAVGIKSAAFSSAGELIITLSDGKSINLGKAVGKDGMNGKNGSDGKDGTNGKDGTDGKDSKNGKNGADGVSISMASVNQSGQLILTFTDGRSVNLDKIVGSDGKTV